MVAEEIEPHEVTSLDYVTLKSMGLTVGRIRRLMAKIKEVEEGTQYVSRISPSLIMWEGFSYFFLYYVLSLN